MLLRVLPHRLLVLSIDYDRLPSLTHLLQQLSLFPPISPSDITPLHSSGSGSNQSSFFSYTLTRRELSLIIPASKLHLFPRSELRNCCPVIWRCIELEADEDGVTTAGEMSSGVYRISNHLAKHGISILQMSTVVCDYTLVAEDNLEKVMQCLGSLCSIDHSTMANGDGDGDDGIAGLLEEIKANASTNTTAVSTSTQQFPYRSPVQEPIVIAGLVDDSSVFGELLYPLLRVMFHQQLTTNTHPQFFSLTIVDGQISLMMSERLLELFPPHSLNRYDPSHGQMEGWKLIEIGDPDSPLGFDEPGIVAAFTKPLANSGVPCFYQATFMCDLVLIPFTYQGPMRMDE